MMLEEFIVDWEGEYHDRDNERLNTFYNATLLIDVGPFKKGSKHSAIDFVYDYESEVSCIRVFKGPEEDLELVWEGEISFTFSECH